MRSHLKVYFSFEDDANALDDGEKANLLLAMYRYAKDGTIPELSGNERFLFPVFKAQIDRDIETYEAKAANGGMGGRQKSKIKQTEANASKSKQTQANESETNLNPKIEDRRYKIEDKRQKIEGDNKRFAPPTLEEVTAYCQERKNKVDPQRFIDFYASKGWKVGNQGMKDWKAAVRTWEKRDSGQQTTASAWKPGATQNYTQRDYSDRTAMLMQRMINGFEEEDDTG